MKGNEGTMRARLLSSLAQPYYMHISTCLIRLFLFCMTRNVFETMNEKGHIKKENRRLKKNSNIKRRHTQMKHTKCINGYRKTFRLAEPLKSGILQQAEYFFPSSIEIAEILLASVIDWLINFPIDSK